MKTEDEILPAPDENIGDENVENSTDVEEVFEEPATEVEIEDTTALTDVAFTNTQISDILKEVLDLKAQNVLILQALTEVSKKLVIDIHNPIPVVDEYELALKSFLGA